METRGALPTSLPQGRGQWWAGNYFAAGGALGVEQCSLHARSGHFPVRKRCILAWCVERHGRYPLSWGPGSAAVSFARWWQHVPCREQAQALVLAASSATLQCQTARKRLTRRPPVPTATSMGCWRRWPAQRCRCATDKQRERERGRCCCVRVLVTPCELNAGTRAPAVETPLPDPRPRCGGSAPEKTRTPVSEVLGFHLS